MLKGFKDSSQVPIVARQLVVQQDVFKFEALSLLHYFLASTYSVIVVLGLLCVLICLLSDYILFVGKFL